MTGGRPALSGALRHAAEVVQPPSARLPEAAAVGPRRYRPGVRPQLIVGAVLVGLVILLALVSLFWTPYNPIAADSDVSLQGPSAAHWLGTDRFGRDVLSRIMAGAQTSVYVGVVAVGIAALIGVPVGLVAGMRRGVPGALLMRGSDILLALPGLLLAIVFGAAFGTGTTTAMVALGIGAIPAFARVTRAGALQVMGADYVLAARSTGRGPLAIAGRHVLPNIAGLIVVQASVNFGLAVLAEAALSFLGLGTTAPTPSWGRMLHESQEFLGSHDYLAIAPGVAIAVAVLGFNLLGDGLRDALDPRLREVAAPDSPPAATAGHHSPNGPHLPGEKTRPALRLAGLRVETRNRELVRGISLTVAAGARVGLIGESGSGKSLTALAVLGLLDDNLHASGTVDIGEQAGLLGRSESSLAGLRGSLAAMVFQEPMTALDPLRRVGRQVAEVLQNHGSTRSAARRAALDLLGEVDLPDPASTARAYPHQLSGGQRQRVLIAMALAGNPALLIADEPTTALDVTVQARILDLLGRLVARRGSGLLFITHDLAVVQRVCEQVVVLKDGLVVEQGSVDDVFGNPQSQHTRALLAASTLTPRRPEPGPRAAEASPPAAGRVPVVRLAEVSKRYQRGRGEYVDALRGIDLEIRQGERFGLVGESGSGKTTALRLLAGLDVPTGGIVEVGGVELAGPGRTRPSRQALSQVRSQLQMVFQDPLASLDPRLRVADIVAEPLLAPLVAARMPQAATRRGRRALAAEMLAAVGLLTKGEYRTIKRGLESIGRDMEAGKMPYDPANEDIHMSVEAELTARIGEPAKKLHSGRSRNDQVATDLRLWAREKQDVVAERLRFLMLSIIEVAERERGLVIPGYTHLQRAQPVLLAHHFLAYVEMFNRDRERLADCRRRTNRLPLGSGALAGTTLPLDREMVRRELGFEALCGNSMDAVSDRDFVVETLSCLSIVAIHTSRLAEDVILWTTSEWGLAKLADAWSTGSSIMPQKRNPDLLELTRGKAGRVIGSLVSLLVTIKGLPMTYNRDLQEDKEPLFDAVRTVDFVLECLASFMPTLKFDRRRAADLLEGGFLDATVLAEYLVEKGLPFRTAHEASGVLVRRAEETDRRLSDLTDAELLAASRLLTPDVRRRLDPARAPESYVTAGSAGPKSVDRALAFWKKKLAK
ncbi:MAG: argininosuccinate lyase [Promicromonosporaceae bacterium]|nr:argininosuccinate lyase [Promicromonosporaceae bacterium]